MQKNRFLLAVLLAFEGRSLRWPPKLQSPGSDEPRPPADEGGRGKSPLHSPRERRQGGEPQPVMGPPTEGPLERWRPHCTLHPTPDPCVPSSPSGTRDQRPGASLPRTGLCPRTQAFPSPEPPAGASPPQAPPEWRAGTDALQHPLPRDAPHTRIKGVFCSEKQPAGPAQ